MEDQEYKNILKKLASEVLSFIQTYCTNKRVMKENDRLPRNTNTKLAVVAAPNECGLNDLKEVTDSPVCKRSHIP
jgi:hypothetical protein